MRIRSEILTDVDLSDSLPQSWLAKAPALAAEFYRRKTPVVARALLGTCMVHRIGDRYFAGIITETEAYLSNGDLASHTANGLTPRNAPMFADGGTCYVYLSYGVNYCMNVVTRTEGVGEAVLIRALRPVSMASEMLRMRSLCAPGSDHRDMPRSKILSVTNGPGKATAAMGIALQQNGTNFFGPALKIVSCDLKLGAGDVVSGPRIGITRAVDLPLRFFIAGTPWVSRPR